MALELVLKEVEEEAPSVEIFSELIGSLKKAGWTKEKAQEVFKVKI